MGESMKLHHIPGSRSCRVRWLFEELGLEYELETYQLFDGSLKAPAYRALNPQGLVPTLEDGNLVLFESGAILQYVLERYGEGRLEPATGDPDRAAYLQWFHWGEATLMPPLGGIMRNRFVLPEPDRSEVALGNARKRFARALDVLSGALGDAEFLVANRFSAADIMCAYGLSLARAVGELPEAPPRAQAYLDAMAARPAFEHAFAGGFGS
jgi:glutathione S-transferase